MDIKKKKTYKSGKTGRSIFFRLSGVAASMDKYICVTGLS